MFLWAWKIVCRIRGHRWRKPHLEGTDFVVLFPHAVICDRCCQVDMGTEVASGNSVN